MIRDITIGQYYRTDSFIHKLDPRTKIIGAFVLIIDLFIFKNPIAYVLAAIYLLSIIKLSKVPFKYILRGLKPIILLIGFTVVCQIMFNKSGDLLLNTKFIRIYSEGVYSAVFLASRIVLLIIGTSMMTYTTTPNQLTDGLERIMKPLKVFGLPLHDIAMIMSIALRFIPILLEECDKIMKAQMARGADFESGNIIVRCKNMVPILVPLFISAFRRANDLALAMESRCYKGGEGRSKMKPLKYNGTDTIAFLYMIIFILLQIILKFI